MVNDVYLAKARERIEQGKEKEIRAEALVLAKKLRLEDEKLREKEGEESFELTGIINKRVVEVELDDYFPFMLCPSCKGKNKVKFSQTAGSLVIWSACLKCKPVPQVKYKGNEKINFQINAIRIPLKDFTSLAQGILGRVTTDCLNKKRMG